MKPQEFREEVNCHDSDWQDAAKRFAKAGVPFVLCNFSFPRHAEFYDKIALAFDLEGDVSLLGQAFLWKRK